MTKAISYEFESTIRVGQASLQFYEGPLFAILLFIAARERYVS